MNRIYAIVVTIIIVALWFFADMRLTQPGVTHWSDYKWSFISIDYSLFGDPISIVKLPNYMMVFLIWWISDWLFSSYTSASASENSHLIRWVGLAVLITGSVVEFFARSSIWTL